jgi:hypothetical protein
MYKSTRKKIRGQKRKLKQLISKINDFNFTYTGRRIEEFSVPCMSNFLDNPRVSSYVRKEFCKAWLNKTKIVQEKKPDLIGFCKVVCVLDTKSLWNSRIIIFLNEDYYQCFWNRDNDYQKWTPILNRSLQQERLFTTGLREQGYMEIIHDEDLWYKTELWFYGELMESMM